jgi:transcriptional regulator with XRE-family HTH domain
MSTEKMQFNDKKNSTFGERLRFFRKAKGLNSNDFAKLLGISQGSLSGLENDKVNTSSETLSNLSKNTNININWLLTGIGNPYKTIDQAENVDPGQSYALGEPIPVYGPDRPNIGPAVDLLANILRSGDQVIVQALMANLHAFNRAVEKDRAQLTRIQELEEKCRVLEERMNAFELRQSIGDKSVAA